MDIYTIQPGDTMASIAERYQIPLDRLLFDNGIDGSYVIGQAIVIAPPSQVHIVQEGDTLSTIADTYHVPLLQLLRNNSFLTDYESLFPGEMLVVSYDTSYRLVTNGYAYPFINRDTLIKTLPSLTYLSVFNYGISEEGEVITYAEDEEIVELAINYGAVPLFMISTLSPHGEPNIELTYSILLNQEYRDRIINSVLNILRNSNYYGINIMISDINEINQQLYINFFTEISTIAKNEGYLLYVTINPNIESTNNVIEYPQLDYADISQLVDGIIFFQYVWGTYTGPPAPVSSINLLRDFLSHIVSGASPDKLSIGKPLIGYDWQLPYVSGVTPIYSISLNSALTLAYTANTAIQFDEISQTPFFQYLQSYSGAPVEHIVWFIDARSVYSLDRLIIEYHLAGSGVWNIMIYYQMLWTLINAQFDIIKLIPDNLDNAFIQQ
jgi:spore germination protein